jgi:uncharacterized protein (UPF0332 family)
LTAVIEQQTPEQRHSELYMRRARRALETARINLDAGDCAASINRAYYAIFYAANALLQIKGLARSKHSAVIAAFREHFVKAGLIEAEYSAIYGRAFSARQVSDYEIQAVPDETIADNILDEASQFVNRVAAYLAGGSPHEP